jgi:hypothetical protein
MQHLRACRPKDVPQHAEKIVIAVDAKNKAEFIRVLDVRMSDLSASQASRIKRVIR